MLFCMQILRRTILVTLTCQWDLLSIARMERKSALKGKKALYELGQSPRAFWRYITVKLEQCDLEQSRFDPCLCIGTDVICAVYVNDLIFWSKDEPLINGVAMTLCELGVDLEQEDDAAGFLRVTLDRDGPSGLLVLKS